MKWCFPVKDLLKPPQSSNFLKDKQGRIYQLGGSWPYIKELQTQGWQDISYYLFAKNSLDADLNLLYGSIQTGIYDAVLTQKQKLVQSLLVNEAKGDIILLDNIEILFDISLKQDPLRLLQGLSRNKTIVAAWNGSIDSNNLIYATPDHPEYKRYPSRDLLIATPEEKT